MNSLVELGQAISDLAEKSLRTGEVIDATAEAMNLSTAHPQSGLTIDEIIEQIERAATIAGAGLYLDGNEDG